MHCSKACEHACRHCNGRPRLIIVALLCIVVKHVSMLAGVVMDDRAFLDAYSKWMPLQHKLEDPTLLGVPEFSPGSFGDCPACAKVPTYDDKGISATCAAASAVMDAATTFLNAAPLHVCPILTATTAMDSSLASLLLISQGLDNVLHLELSQPTAMKSVESAGGCHCT